MAQPPRVARRQGLPLPLGIHKLPAFRTLHLDDVVNIYFFGLLTTDGRTVSQVEGKRVTPLGPGSIDVYVRLGRALATEGKVTLRIGSPAPAIAAAFRTRKEPNLPYATSNPLPMGGQGEWLVFEATPETLPKVWPALGPLSVLHADDYYGLVIMAPSGRFMPAPERLPR